MFEVGKTYEITSVDGDEREYMRVTIDKVEMPLISVTLASGKMIINTASSTFVSAKEMPANAGPKPWE